MKLASSIICAFILIGVLCYKTFGANGDVGHGIQILSPNTSSFVLDMNELQKILESENIKDRYVMVFSIAGAFRQGKSFLLNFFLKYLEAQVTNFPRVISHPKHIFKFIEIVVFSAEF